MCATLGSPAASGCRCGGETLAMRSTCTEMWPSKRSWRSSKRFANAFSRAPTPCIGASRSSAVAAAANSRVRSLKIWPAQDCTSWPAERGSENVMPASLAPSAAGQFGRRLADDLHGVHQFGRADRHGDAQFLRQRRGRKDLGERAHHQGVDRVAEVDGFGGAPRRCG